MEWSSFPEVGERVAKALEAITIELTRWLQSWQPPIVRRCPQMSGLQAVLLAGGIRPGRLVGNVV